MDWYQASSPEHQKKERNKARDLRKSQWWKNELGKGLCHYCSERFQPTQLTMDHKQPIARGGVTSKSNVVTACKACNSQKQSSTASEFALSEGT
jgi:5-methylcytosine-specific restriction protein A